MKLKYYNIKERLYPSLEPEEGFVKDLKLIDNRLDVAYNRKSGRWEIYRLSNRGWQWILEVSEEDGSYRQLDSRTLNKLRQMDIIARFGSVANYERHLDEKLRKYKESEQRKNDHELKCDIKDDKKLWQRAAENLRSGIV